MSKRLAIGLSVVWLVSLGAVAGVTAQVMPHVVPAKVLPGSDVGFLVEAIDPKDGAAIGFLVINVNGKWVEARVGGIGPRQGTP